MNKFKVAKAISFLWISSFAGAGLAFVTQIILARNLGVDGFGVFSSALATVTLLSPLAGFGVASLWLKVFGLEGVGGGRWLKPSFVFVLISTVLVLVMVALWAVLGFHDDSSRALILILATCVIGQVSTELVSSKFQLEERYLEMAAWQLFPHCGRFFLVASIFYLLGSYAYPSHVAFAYSATSILVMFVAVTVLKKMVQGGFLLKERRDIQAPPYKSVIGLKEVLSSAWPFGVGAFAHLIYFQSDIILVKYMVGDSAAGEYNVAFTVMSAVYLFPSVVYQKFLMPKIHRWSYYDKSRFYLVYKRGSLWMLFFGLFAMCAIWILGGWGVELLFGVEYSASSELLDILAVSAPVIFLALSAGSVLVTQEHMVDKVKYMIFVAFINIILNFFFIPVWGAEGAAIATVLSNLILLVLYLYGASRKVFMIKVFGK